MFSSFALYNCMYLFGSSKLPIWLTGRPAVCFITIGLAAHLCVVIVYSLLSDRRQKRAPWQGEEQKQKAVSQKLAQRNFLVTATNELPH